MTARKRNQQSNAMTLSSCVYHIPQNKLVLQRVFVLHKLVLQHDVYLTVSFWQAAMTCGRTTS